MTLAHMLCRADRQPTTVPRTAWNGLSAFPHPSRYPEHVRVSSAAPCIDLVRLPERFDGVACARFVSDTRAVPRRHRSAGRCCCSSLRRSPTIVDSPIGRFRQRYRPYLLASAERESVPSVHEGGSLAGKDSIIVASISVSLIAASRSSLAAPWVDREPPTELWRDAVRRSRSPRARRRAWSDTRPQMIAATARP